MRDCSYLRLGFICIVRVFEIIYRRKITKIHTKFAGIFFVTYLINIFLVTYRVWELRLKYPDFIRFKSLIIKSML